MPRAKVHSSTESSSILGAGIAAPPQSYPVVDGAAVGFCVNESYNFRAALQLQSVWIDSPQNKAA